MLPYWAPSIAGVVMLMLAAWLFWVSPERRQARAFAVLLIVRGLSLIALTTAVTSTSLALTKVAVTAYPGFCLATVFAVVYFLGVYPAPRSWMPRGIWGPLMFLVPLILIETALILNPDLVRPMEFLTDVGPDAFMQLMGTTPMGPIGIAPTLLDLAMALPAFVLVREVLLNAPGRKRSSLLLVSFGFFAPAACSCLMARVFLLIRGSMPPLLHPSLFNYVAMAIFGVWVLAMTSLLLYLGIKVAREPELQARRAAAMFAIIITFSALIGIAAAMLPDPRDAIAAIFVMVAFWSTLGALLVTYGVLRHALFDIDIKVKVTVERSTVAAVFVAVYFLVSEIAAQLFEDYSGSAYLGIVAAALLLLIFNRIERFASAVVDGSMPRTKSLPDLDSEERRAFYREQVELMWMDGALTAKDRLVLANLRTKLGLGAEDAELIEIRVVGAG